MRRRKPNANAPNKKPLSAAATRERLPDEYEHPPLSDEEDDASPLVPPPALLVAVPPALVAVPPALVVALPPLLFAAPALPPDV
ncbi:MAG TPA: hypothetical protein VHV51_08705, partial [Polyangiaceae bacterium]|nr:hypothetical protein [Polyangiaceae bacterium]